MKKYETLELEIVSVGTDILTSSITKETPVVSYNSNVGGLIDELLGN